MIFVFHLGNSVGFQLRNIYPQAYENISEKIIWDPCTGASPELRKYHCRWKWLKFQSQITPVFRNTVVQNISSFFFCLVAILRACLCVLQLAEMFPRKRNGKVFYCLALFWIVCCCCVHLSITAVLQAASERQSERKRSSKADPILFQSQEYSGRSLLSLWSAHRRWPALRSAPFRLSQCLTVLSFTFPLGFFWTEADSPVQKTPAVTSYHFPSATS